MSQKNKNIILGVVLLVVIFMAYSFFFKKDSNESPLIAESTLSQNKESGVVEEFLVLLRTLNNLKLDAELFNDEVYRSLRDESVELVGQPRGRVNPFAPL
ncbi:MAG: hypothetical protein HYT93_03270 [Parcubacteria group bacterium]|nr:hypothetical protein [Parcubacteria group bacterium]